MSSYIPVTLTACAFEQLIQVGNFIFVPFVLRSHGCYSPLIETCTYQPHVPVWSKQQYEICIIRDWKMSATNIWTFAA
jgi:hypothetical protein